MNKRPTEPAPNAPTRRPTPPISSGATGKRTPKEEAEKKAMEKKYPFNKYAKGGSVDGVARKGKTSTKRVVMAKGGKCYAKGGSVDGIARKGKTKGKVV
jgi:hypothetical protein